MDSYGYIVANSTMAKIAVNSTRRNFLKFLLMGAGGMVVDPELLLWKPDAKKIFIMDVPAGISYAEIINLEVMRMVPHIRDLFERDDLFYQAIRTKEVTTVTAGQMEIPLKIKEEGKKY